MRSVARILHGLGAPRVLVIGDVVLDRYVLGRVERISPEAPIQVLHVESTSERLGAAAFSAQAAAALGASVTLFGVVGDDDSAGRMRALAETAGIEAVLVAEAGRATTVKTRHIAHSHIMAQQVLRVDEETLRPLDEATESALRSALRERLSEADIVLVNDYGKGTLTAQLLQDLIGAARDADVPVIVDPHKERDFTRYRGATGITPNRPETARATGQVVTTVDEARASATQLLMDLELQFALITLDRDGMLLQSGESGLHIATTPREVFDVTGAGDTVLSAFGVALASGASPAEAASLANVAAGLQVEHVGVRPVTRDEIAMRLHATGQDPVAKRTSAADLVALGERLRARGKRVVFTNGCFDLLHAGHVAYLTEAKAQGDVLIVGLNTDESVSRLKGPERPLNTLDDRAMILAGLAAVDYVVDFGEDTPIELITALQPDVLVKGMDWKDKGVVGRDVVEARGGKVVLVDLLAGRSTTDLVKRARRDEPPHT